MFGRPKSFGRPNLFGRPNICWTSKNVWTSKNCWTSNFFWTCKTCLHVQTFLPAKPAIIKCLREHFSRIFAGRRRGRAHFVLGFAGIQHERKPSARSERGLSENENENKNASENENESGRTCEGGAKRPLVGCFSRYRFRFRFCFRFRFRFRFVYSNVNVLDSLNVDL